MSEINRFSFSTKCEADIRENNAGEYVLYTDYQAAQAKIKELEEMGTVKQRMRFANRNNELEERVAELEHELEATDKVYRMNRGYVESSKARIAELEAKSEKLRTQVADFEIGAEQNEFYLRQHDRIEKLEQANKIMREALGYLNGEHGIAAPAMVKSHQVVISEAIKQADEILGE